MVLKKKRYSMRPNGIEFLGDTARPVAGARMADNQLASTGV